MHDFSLQVALIWAQVNATTSVAWTAKDFAAAVVDVALDVKRGMATSVPAEASLESAFAEPPKAHLPHIPQCSAREVAHAETGRAGE